MEIDDRYVTAVPEGMHLEVVLAGAGSRFAAYLVDLLIQIVGFVVLLLATALAASRSGETGTLIVNAVFVLYYLFCLVGYFVMFDLLWSGRSPGKRLLGIRVVKAGGQPVGFWASLLRNFGRLIDTLPGLYLVGFVLIFATNRNQRVGDLIAGTLVVRDKTGAEQMQGAGPGWSGQAFAGSIGAPAAQNYGPAGQPWLPPELAHWDVSALPPQELELVRTFLANRGGYTPDARYRLSVDLANRVWPFVAGPPSPPPPEAFLEMVAHVKAVRG